MAICAIADKDRRCRFRSSFVPTKKILGYAEPTVQMSVRDGADITGASDVTYDLVQADVGSAITAIASYTDGEGISESVTSDNTRAVVNLSHSTTGTVSITYGGIE